MRKYLISLLLILIVHYTKGQEIKFKKDSISINQAISEFIYKANSESIANGKYNVFFLKTLNFNLIKRKFEFSLGYFFNESTLEYIDADYFSINKSNLLVIKKCKSCNDIENFLNLNKIDTNNITIIRNKLLPTKEGVITGTSSSAIYIQIKDSIEITEFEDANLPHEYTMFKNFPSNFIIESIE